MSEPPVPAAKRRRRRLLGHPRAADRALPRAAAVRGRRPAGDAAGGLDAAGARARALGDGRRDVRLKLEGANPTGSFKDRGMTCAVSAAVREGAKAVICASTGNTAASAAAYAARAGITLRGDRARRQDRAGQAGPDAGARRARDRAARQLRPGARCSCASSTDSHPIALVNSVNEFRIEGQKTAAFEIHEELEGRLDALCIPVGNAGNITSYWRGFQELGAAPRMLGFQAEGAAPLVDGQRRRAPRNGRQRDPHRQPRALGGRDGRGDATRAARSARSATRRSSTPTGCSPRAKACSASRPRRRRWRGCSSTAPKAREQIVCVLTGPRPEGPRDGDRQQRRQDHHRARPSWRRSRKRCWVIRRRAACACRRPRRTSGPGSTAWPPRSRCTWSSRSRRRASFAVETDLPVAARAREPAACAPSSGCTRPTASRSGSAREIPLSGGLGSSAAAIVAGLMAADHLFELDADLLGARDRARGPSRQRRRRAARRLRGLRRRRRRRASSRRPGLEALAVVPDAGGAHAGRARGAAAPRCRSADAVFNVAHARAADARAGARRLGPARARACTTACTSSGARTCSRARCELAERARELGALGATISGAGPTVLVWCFYEQTGAVAEALRGRGRGLGAAAARAVRAAGRLRRASSERARRASAPRARRRGRRAAPAARRASAT